MYKIKLSPYHKIFYNEWKLDPLSSKYNIVFDQTISSALDIPRLKNALYRFVADYLIINSHVKEIDGELYWVPNLQIYELEHFDGQYTHEQVFEYVSEPFNIESGPLYRFAVFNEVDGSYRFVFELHHLLMDGISVDISISEISNYYNSLQYKTRYPLPEQKTFIENATELFNNQIVPYSTQYQEFWDRQLCGVEALDIRWLKPINPIAEKHSFIKEYRFSLKENETVKLKNICKKFGITPYIYSQCIFAILLYRYSSQDKFAICYPIAIKGGVPFVCGVQINTNLRVYEFNNSTTILDLFNQNKMFLKYTKNMDGNSGYYPVDKIIANSNKNILNIIFAQTSLKDTKFNFADTNTLKINYDFNIDIAAPLVAEQEYRENTFHYQIRYSILEADEVILQNFGNHFKNLFLNTLNDLENGISDKIIDLYEILNMEEYQRIVYELNKTEAEYPINKSIHQLFQEQVTKYPNNIAVINGNCKLSYLELDSMSNQFAHYLMDRYKIQKNDLIALCLDRNEYVLIAILAVLKSGGAYVPLDPLYPNERISYILRETNAKILLTNSVYYQRLSKLGNLTLLAIDSKEAQANVAIFPTSNTNVAVNGKNLVYVIYTSGTTGKPKGVMIEHHNMINATCYFKNKFFNSKDNINTLSTTNYVFDIWGLEYAIPLLSGGSITLSDANFKDINGADYDFIQLTPQVAAIKYEEIKNSQELTLFIGGERVPHVLISTLQSMPIKTIVNVYGPTETTIWSTCHVISNESIILIGKPIANTKVYIVNRNINILPIGAIGELYIGGDGVSRGYINQPVLTSEKFINNPFQDEKEKNQNKNALLYKTGDLGRLLPDGNIEFIGRNDSQIKIRGYRIELDEIANVLSSYPRIKQSVVVVSESQSHLSLTRSSIGSGGFPKHYQYIVAYYTSTAELNEVDIINYLDTILPQYMLPNILMRVEKFPITLQGKLDYRLLPEPNFIQLCDFIAPNNDSELTICQAYAEVLKLPLIKIGVNHDFFELGGNSITAIRLTAKLQHNFKITVNDIFKLRTPSKLAKSVVFTKDNLKYKLEQIKLLYKKVSENWGYRENLLDKKRKDYATEIKNIDFNNDVKPIKSVLLTGATGYLGSNILYQLLLTTGYNIYLLIRAPSNEQAYIRVKDKVRFYFDIDLDLYEHRIIAIAADLEKQSLDLDSVTYNNLIQEIDSIIHTAALVKHYGNYDLFFQSNVQSTNNLLELAQLTSLKDFHYISTISVFMDGYVPDMDFCIFDENSNIEILKNKTNIYVQTKYSGEQLVLKFRESGICGNIYRVGNLSMNSINFKNQENIDSNSFFTRIKAILNLGTMPKELSYVEISPVDCTANAIVKLFDKVELSNNIFHIFNPQVCNLFNLFSSYQNIKINKVPFYKFIDILLEQLENNNNEQVELFMLHQSWLQNIDIRTFTQSIVLQDITEAILNKLDFKWPVITSDMLSNIIYRSFEG